MVGFFGDGGGGGYECGSEDKDLINPRLGGQILLRYLKGNTLWFFKCKLYLRSLLNANANTYTSIWNTN